MADVAGSEKSGTEKSGTRHRSVPAEGAGTERELLRRLGIEVAATEPNGPIRAACLRAAQKLQRGGYVTIGLLPASANVGVVWAGVNLAVSLAELSGSTVACSRANP